VIPYNPLAGGFLTGKHDRNAPPSEGTRFSVGDAGRRYRARYWHEDEFETVEALRAVAVEADISMATMAVAWVLSNPAITAPIVGASRPEQLADSLAAPEKGPLPADLKARLDEMTQDWRRVDAER
jgi:1-deoxyxylulose-5-phosphate synthase